MVVNLAPQLAARYRRPAAIFIVGALLIVGCSPGRTVAPTVLAPPTSATAPLSPSPVPVPSGTSGMPRFEPGMCPFDAEQTPGYAVDCGFVVVPARHRDPSGPTIRLAVARFRSQSPTPAPDPVLYLAGGPGGPGLVSVFTAQIAYTFTPARDFIAFDQRGVGQSAPALDCPELAQQTRQELMQDEGATDELAHEAAARFRCRDRLEARGIDLTAYTTTESAADVDDIRAALGYDKLDLLGTSYGSRLALVVMRDFPGIIRSVVLDGVAPPQADEIEELSGNADRALTLAFQGCAAAKACRQDVPTLRADFDQAVAALNARPLTLANVVLTGDRFSAQIVYLLSDRMSIGMIPALIEAARRGDTAAVRVALASYGTIGTLGNSVGMGTSVVCDDTVPFNSRERTIAAAQTVPPGIRASVLPLALSYFDLCAGWPGNPPDPRNHRAVTSDLPTLILESANDPATPPANGQLAGRTLSRSFYVETPGVGHTVVGTACGGMMMARFIADPTRTPDMTCTVQMRVTYAQTG